MEISEYDHNSMSDILLLNVENENCERLFSLNESDGILDDRSSIQLGTKDIDLTSSSMTKTEFRDDDCRGQ